MASEMFHIIPGGRWGGCFSVANSLGEAISEMEDYFGPLPPQAEIWHHWKSGQEWWMEIKDWRGVGVGRIGIDAEDVT